jgi:ParB-like chromosome segregation protein Spo0J
MSLNESLSTTNEPTRPPLILAPSLSEDAEFTELGQVLFLQIDHVRPSAQNDTLYRPTDDRDPELRALAQSIEREGILEPLAVTVDKCRSSGAHWIISGHRRYAAALIARLDRVPCRVVNIRSDDADFSAKLTEYNRQRDKTIAERLREEIVRADPDESYRALQAHRTQVSKLEDVDIVPIIGKTKRAAISKAKAPLLAAIDRVLQDRRKFWPLSDRQIHYALLNAPPLIHASKPDSIYQNNKHSYKSLVELLTRARLCSRISWQAIADPTRPVTIWDVHPTTTPFMREELGNFLKNYHRNLQQSQPNHIEIIGEKNTVESTLKPIAAEYCIPLTIGRGYCSLDPRFEMARRFRKSGKEKLILLILSDFDPDGEEICHSFARSMRDDFGVWNLAPVKVALTSEQVARLNLPANNMEAKKSSTNYKKFVAKYGKDVYELEALSPEVLQSELRAAIDSVIDCDAFNHEIEAERQDAAELDEIRRRAHRALSPELETP